MEYDDQVRMQYDFAMIKFNNACRYPYKVPTTYEYPTYLFNLWLQIERPIQHQRARTNRHNLSDQGRSLWMAVQSADI